MCYYILWGRKILRSRQALGGHVLKGMVNLPLPSYLFWNFVLCRSWGTWGRPAVLTPCDVLVNWHCIFSCRLLKWEDGGVCHGIPGATDQTWHISQDIVKEIINQKGTSLESHNIVLYIKTNSDILANRMQDWNVIINFSDTRLQINCDFFVHFDCFRLCPQTLEERIWVPSLCHFGGFNGKVWEVLSHVDD